MSKLAALETALSYGEELTEKQIRARFGLANPRAAVSALRLNKGHSVYLNARTDTSGRTKMKYRFGTPTKRVVAIGNMLRNARAFYAAF